MKLAPTVLVLAAFGVLLWVSNQKPASADGEGAGGGHAPAHGNAHGDPHGAAPVASGTQVEKTIPATPLLPPPPRNPNSVVVMVRDGAGHGQPQIDVTLADGSGKAIATRRSDASGRAAFDNVAAGRYSVTAFDQDFLYTAAAPATVDAKKDVTNDLELRVDRGTARIEGRLVDGGELPIAEKTVSFSAGGATFSVRTDAKGRFLVGGLAPGNWTVTPDGFAEQKQTVKLTDGATANATLKLARSAKLSLTIAGSHLHPARFQGDEKALIRSAGATKGEPIAHALEAATGAKDEHHAALGTSFAGLVAGDYEIDVVGGDGKSLLATGAAWSKPVPVTLLEGDDRAVPLTTAASTRGSGVTVPTWAIVFMCLVIGGMVFVTPVIFPPPVVAKRPLGLQR